MPEIAIRVDELSKRYQLGAAQVRHDTLRDALAASLRRNGKQAESNTLWALKDVSFEIKKGEVVGVIGRNGAGKSTLLKILSRITEPTSGRAEIHGRVGSLLEVGTGFHPELTGRENIYLNGAILGMKRVEIAAKFDEIVAFAEIERFLDTPVKRYSSGMYVRLAFAVAAHLEPEILLVDEVLAVGDIGFQRKCLGKMGDVAHAGRTVLFVSHNMAAIEDLCHASLLLRDGRLDFSGPTKQTIERYLKSGTAANRVRFERGPLTSAEIEQSGDKLVLRADYVLDKATDMPALGFVISDFMGNPICGAHPRQEPLSGIPAARGTVRATIAHPKLLNGMYRVSLWFGDQRGDFFEARDCLVFEAVNMAGPKPFPAQAVGSAAVECQWDFAS